MAPRASVIVSTRHQARLLDLALHSFARQSCLDFELLVADDGSGGETLSVVQSHAARFPVRLEHVWQPDEGPRIGLARNRAVLRSRGELLIFGNAGGLAAGTLVEEHLRRLGPEPRYGVGGCLTLSSARAQRLTVEQVRAGAFERASGLRRRLGLALARARTRLELARRRRPGAGRCACNFSVGRETFFVLNGFDNAADGLELCDRLPLAGVRARTLGYRARVLQMAEAGARAGLGGSREGTRETRGALQPVAPSGLREVPPVGASSAPPARERSPSPLRSV